MVVVVEEEAAGAVAAADVQFEEEAAEVPAACPRARQQAAPRFRRLMSAADLGAATRWFGALELVANRYRGNWSAPAAGRSARSSASRHVQPPARAFARTLPNAEQHSAAQFAAPHYFPKAAQLWSSKLGCAVPIAPSLEWQPGRRGAQQQPFGRLAHGQNRQQQAAGSARSNLFPHLLHAIIS